jgi:hypothetical protein
VDGSALFERTGGNPFFIAEVLAAGGTAVPATVRDAVLARVSLLAEGTRDAVRAAAVLGYGANRSPTTRISGQGRCLGAAHRSRSSGTHPFPGASQR